MIRVATQKTWGWAETDTRNLGGLSPASPAGSRFSLPGVGMQPQSQEITIPGEKSPRGMRAHLVIRKRVLVLSQQKGFYLPL